MLKMRDARDAYLETNKIIGFCLSPTYDSYEAMLATSQFETICLLNPRKAFDTSRCDSTLSYIECATFYQLYSVNRLGLVRFLNT